MNRRLMLCVVGFAVLCVAVVMFLQPFMSEQDFMRYVTFQSVVRIGEDGSLTSPPMDEYGRAAGMEDGAVYRFCAVVEDIPEYGYLVLKTSGVEFTVRIDGETVLQSTGPVRPPVEAVSVGQVHISLPSAAEHCDLEIDCRVLDPENAWYPPLARYTSESRADRSTMAYANLYGIPTGAFMLAFVCLCGLFLLGLAQNKPDYTLLVLALAAGLLGVCRISAGCGYHFLPRPLYHFLLWPGFNLLPPALLLAWLLLGRRRGTWRQFGWSALVTCAAVLCVYLVSLIRGRYNIAGYIKDVVAGLFYGRYSELVYWLTVFLVFDSAVIAIYGVLRDFARMETTAQALALKSELTLENYRAMEEKLRQTAALRHEWKNQVAALHLLQEKGDLDGLGRQLKRLDSQLDKLSPRQYSQHLAINIILQSAAARAETLDITFRAAAPVPAGLGIREDDLCSLLLNLLDNALEAASKIPSPGVREVECTIKVKQGYLAVKCENTYAGPLPVDENGRLRSAKADYDSHGLGLLQMNSIAKKYGSVLDVSYTGSRFTVQAALKIR